MRTRDFAYLARGPLFQYSDLMEGRINTLRLRQNECHISDDISKRIFPNENVRIPIKISVKFVPRGRINNIPALVQIMAWRRPGDKPLSEPMIVILPTHICVTRPQWVNQAGSEVNTIPADALAMQGARSSAAMVLIMKDKLNLVFN